MTTGADVPYLRLLPSASDDSRPMGTIGEGAQATLFPLPDTSLLAFVSIDVLETSFERLLSDLHPRCVVDLRPLPRFDFGQMNRRRAFETFNRLGATYFDLGGQLGLETSRSSLWSSEELRSAIAEALESRKLQRLPAGPVMVIVDDRSVAEYIASWLPGALPRPRNGWRVFVT
jgi:hypothetical protein